VSWVAQRFGVELSAESEVVPTLGVKEAIFSFAQIVLDPSRGKNVVVTTEPGYPVPERGARFAGAEVLQLPLLEENAFLPALESVDPAVWDRTAVVWVNYPNNPTAATAPRSLYEHLAALAEAHDFVVASDEAYSELWFDEPPISALQATDRSRLVVFNSLSKRSSMTGYRAGFVAGSREIVAALKLFRPSVGTAPQEFVQRAAVAAWEDERHVIEARERYARKRQILLDALGRGGYRVAGSRATMYLWVEVPGAERSESFASRLLAEHGIVVVPGSYLGPSGEGYVRLALVPSVEECQEAAAILEAMP
jgi:acetylornithine aminotransferase